MSSFPEICRTIVEWRIDALASFVLLVAGWLVSYVRLRDESEGLPLAPRTALGVGGLILTALLLTEGTTYLLRHLTDLPAPSLLAVRVALLTAVSAATGIFLWASVQQVRWRTSLRARAEIEAQLQQAKTAADAANRAKSDFIAVMSHELRTPLNAVQGFARLLGETRLEGVQRDYLTTIAAESDRLGGLISDILDFTRLERGELVLESATFGPVAAARETLRRFAPRAEAKGLELRFEAQVHGPLLVNGDERRFQQVLTHLVDNAIKFTPRGSVTLFLSWTLIPETEPSGRLSIRVQDTGIGIPLEKQAELFRSFTPLDASASRPNGGTGLGLVTAQRLVTLMGGEIKVRSTPEHGTEMAFVLPVPPVALSETPFDQEKYDRLFPQPPRVLVVDDLETNRFLLEIFLRRNGFEPELAGGGEEAVRLATAQRFDAILMDLHMPNVDGFAATARIRAAEPSNRRTPIVALTASLAKGTRAKCLAAGMDDQLTKPLDVDKFRRVLATLASARLEAKNAGEARKPIYSQ